MYEKKPQDLATSLITTTKTKQNKYMYACKKGLWLYVIFITY